MHTTNKNYINWDANACFGVLPEVAEALKSIFGKALNPSSIHSGGQYGRGLIESARSEILNLIGNPQDARLIFTSGATESNNTIMNIPLWQAVDRGFKFSDRTVIISAFEHPSVLEPALRLKAFGFNILQLNIQNLEEAAMHTDANTVLVSMMLANNETGQVYGWDNTFKTKFPKVFLHSDAVQILGKTELNFNQLNLDAITLSAHKIGGLTGVGAMVVKERTIYEPLLLGGAQELRFRSGTENLLGIVSFGISAEIAKRDLAQRQKQMLEGKEYLISKISSLIPKAKILFTEKSSLPNTISVHFPGILADDLVVALDIEKIYVSSGSACASGKPLPSHVLLANGFNEQSAKEVLRISLTGKDTEKELEESVGKLISAVKRMYEQVN